MARTPERPAGAQRFVVIAVSLAVLLVLAAGALVGWAVREGPKGAAGTVLASAIGGPFQLVDQNGKPFGDADLKGKWHLVFFGYTHCPDTCPTTLNELSLALDRLGKERDAVGIVFITVDPERDTPPVLKSYLAAFGPQFVGLTGSTSDIADVAHAYRIYFKKVPVQGGGYSLDHSSAILLLDPNGHFVKAYDEQSGAAAIASDLKKQF